MSDSRSPVAAALDAISDALGLAMHVIEQDEIRIQYVARYWQTQTFQEIMSGTPPHLFTQQLDVLMKQHPQID